MSHVCWGKLFSTIPNNIFGKLRYNPIKGWIYWHRGPGGCTRVREYLIMRVSGAKTHVNFQSMKWKVSHMVGKIIGPTLTMWLFASIPPHEYLALFYIRVKFARLLSGLDCQLGASEMCNLKAWRSLNNWEVYPQWPKRYNNAEWWEEVRERKVSSFILNLYRSWESPYFTLSNIGIPNKYVLCRTTGIYWPLQLH